MSDERRRLKREYKDTAKPMGIYSIRNTRNGKRYVAASRNIAARLNRHRFQLRMGSEEVRSLLAEWVEFGEEAFEFEVLDLLEPLDKPGYEPGADLRELERLWLEKLQPYGERGYNPAPTQ